MTIETDLYAAINATFAGGAFADTAPADNPTPFCIYQNVGGQPVTTFCGDAERNNVIQFWVWAATRNEANTKMRALASIVTAAPFRAVSQGGLSAEFDDITRTYGAMQRFSFWS